MQRLISGVLAALCAAVVQAADPPMPVALGDQETIVFLTDWIDTGNRSSREALYLYGSGGEDGIEQRLAPWIALHVDTGRFL